jgi:hypothetical protein
VTWAKHGSSLDARAVADLQAVSRVWLHSFTIRMSKNGLSP